MITLNETRSNVKRLNHFVEIMGDCIDNKATKRALHRVNHNLLEFLKLDTGDPTFFKFYIKNPIRMKPDATLDEVSD